MNLPKDGGDHSRVVAQSDDPETFQEKFWTQLSVPETAVVLKLRGQLREATYTDEVIDKVTRQAVDKLMDLREVHHEKYAWSAPVQDDIHEARYRKPAEETADMLRAVGLPVTKELPYDTPNKLDAYLPESNVAQQAIKTSNKSRA